jgi:hypothetical protein
MKLIAHPFDGDKRKLREFIENVDGPKQTWYPLKICESYNNQRCPIQANSQRPDTQLGIGKGDTRRKIRN